MDDFIMTVVSCMIPILSMKLGKLSVKNYDQIIKTAKKFEKNIGLLESIQKDLKVEKVLESFFSDKISDNNLLNFVLPTDSGYFIYKNTPRKTVVEVVDVFKNLEL